MLVRSFANGDAIRPKQLLVGLPSSTTQPSIMQGLREKPLHFGLLINDLG